MENLKKASSDTVDQLIKIAIDQESPKQKLELLVAAITLLNALVEEGS